MLNNAALVAKIGVDFIFILWDFQHIQRCGQRAPTGCARSGVFPILQIRVHALPTVRLAYRRQYKLTLYSTEYGKEYCKETPLPSI